VATGTARGEEEGLGPGGGLSFMASTSGFREDPPAPAPPPEEEGRPEPAAAEGSSEE
jgi:hypothetical protein